MQHLTPPRLRERENMPNPDRKYPTYKALAKAFACGELDPKKYRLILDNDSSRLRRIDIEEPSDDDYDKAMSLFEGYGCYYEDVLEMLAAAGIPAESV